MIDPAQKKEWQETLERQKERVLQTKGGTYPERLAHLEGLKKLLIEHEEEWMTALEQDLGKSAVDSYTSEIAVVLNEIDYAKRRLKKWMKPQRTKHFSLSGSAKTRVSWEPYGAVLILSPWNYPVQLALLPLVGALAAGNSCFLKPSEQASAVSHVLAKLLARYFDPKVITVIEGESETAAALLTLKWDFIFFTGSKKIGKKVYRTAAEHLIPVALELGGKNPCIVDASGLSKETVRQIAWGKFLNAGQTCVAPDTVYVHESIYPQFLAQLKQQLLDFYGPDPQNSWDYGRMIHKKHLNTVVDYLTEGNVYHGGAFNEEKLYLAPTILTDIQKDSAVGEEEIFGPILPVIPYHSLTSLVQDLQQKPVPLVTYVFSQDSKVVHLLEQQLSSGAFSLNQVIRFAANPEIPFGGLQESGFGRYHGQSSFKTFSCQRVVYAQRSLFALPQQYPPYRMEQLKWLKKWRRRLF